MVTDEEIVQAFKNFLSWGERPALPRPAMERQQVFPARRVPPAWWAYVLGDTRWCPPKGVL